MFLFYYVPHVTSVWYISPQKCRVYFPFVGLTVMSEWMGMMAFHYSKQSTEIKSVLMREKKKTKSYLQKLSKKISNDRLRAIYITLIDFTEKKDQMMVEKKKRKSRLTQTQANLGFSYLDLEFMMTKFEIY